MLLVLLDAAPVLLRLAGAIVDSTVRPGRVGIVIGSVSVVMGLVGSRVGIDRQFALTER